MQFTNGYLFLPFLPIIRKLTAVFTIYTNGTSGQTHSALSELVSSGGIPYIFIWYRPEGVQGKNVTYPSAPGEDHLTYWDVLCLFGRKFEIGVDQYFSPYLYILPEHQIRFL